MKESGVPSAEGSDDLGLALSILRSLRGLSQKQLAALLHTHKSRVSRLETAQKMPGPRQLAQFLEVCGTPSFVLTGVLLPFLAALRGMLDPQATLLPGDAQQVARLSPIAREATAHGLNALLGLLAEMDLTPTALAGISTSQDGGGSPWPDAAPPSPASDVEQKAWPAFEDLVLHLCDASIAAATESASTAYELAALAVRVSGPSPGPHAWRQRLSGYAHGFLANALRVQGDLCGSDSTFAEAWRLWRLGDDPPGTRLAEWRLLHLEASTRRELRQLHQSAALLDRALVLAPAEAHARILCSKSLTLDQSGDVEQALLVLAEAERVAPPADSSLSWSLRFNRAVLLCHLADYGAADDLLRPLETAAREQGDHLNALRVLWARSRVSQGLGDAAAAIAALEQVRLEFCRREMPYDTALASLELAAAYLRDRRYDDVQQIAAELGWVFATLAVPREALAALQLFHEAAQAKTATLSMIATALRQLGGKATFPVSDTAEV